jgi:predicted SAM-dependent methyltransferase|tara:strand:- start:54475 stop:54921 length:447 start_codon:yes stop_codon:yes gene_type:complete
MKVNLTIGGAKKSGYLNIDALENLEIRNLDEYVDNAECFEIIADDVIDYLPRQEISVVIDNWVSKLRHQGTIVIGGTDAYEVCKMFSQNAIDLQELNNLFHGQQTQEWDVRLNQLTLQTVSEELEKRGLKTLKKRINGFKFSVEAERP